MSELNTDNEGLTRRKLLMGAAAGGGLLLFAGSLAACTGSGTATSPTTGGSPAPKKGGNLRIGLTGEQFQFRFHHTKFQYPKSMAQTLATRFRIMFASIVFP